jgi:aminoglycoside phosphotransferase (APT) family kinase protein
MIRRNAYSWKCDRPAAFHGTLRREAADATLAAAVAAELRRYYATNSVTLAPGPGRGNHLTWLATVDGRPLFIRVENGPEADGHLAVESAVLERVRAEGVPTPRVYGCDVSRRGIDFSWQALERIDAPDLNHWFREGLLDGDAIAHAIGRAVATWQEIEPAGFGVLDTDLHGAWPTYADFYHLRLDEHLAFLVRHGLISLPERAEITAEIERHGGLLALDRACLVHKDLALWNILGTPRDIAAFIDFDDAVGGDPLDDLSLLGCFHDRAFLRQAVAGYASVRPLPAEHRRRFWLHLLRNMIVKAVIRAGAGYFDRDDGLFLIGRGSTGSDLRRFTVARLERALRGLRDDDEIEAL